MKIGFVELLTLVLIVLKLLGKISIGWLMVFSPMLVTYALVTIFLLAVVALNFFVGRE